MKWKNTQIKRYVRLVIKSGGWKILLMFIFMILTSALNVIQPKILSYLIDKGIGGKSINILFIMTGSYILCNVIVRILNIHTNNYFETLKLVTATKLKKALMEKLARAQGTYISGQATGEILYILDNDIYQLEGFGIEFFLELIMNVITAVVVFVILLRLNIEMLFLVGIIQILMIIFQKIMSVKITTAIRNVRDVIGELSNLQEQFVSNLKTVILSDVADFFLRIFNAEQQNYCEKSKKTNKFILYQREIIGFLQSFSLVASYLVGGIMIINARLTLGELIAFIQYVNMLIAPCVLIANSNIEIKQIEVALNRIYGELDRIDTIEDDKKKERIDKIDKISFENVSFRYSEKDVLKNINMEFEKNSITAIVGESGCGKSTILNILYGLWKPQSGNIYFNSWPYEKLNIKSVRNNITIVCQEPFLFNSSIIDNIKMGNEGNDQEKIDQVIKCVGLEMLIEEKEEENVGEKGNNLSGGQKQRVAIARALLRDSNVIVFDEATSNLDNLSQKEIMNNISSYFKDKIVIIIAHRLSTIKSADRIIVMHKGEIVESGTEDYLLSKNGFYKKLDNTDEGEKIC